MPAPDYAVAKVHYEQAETAMRDGHFADAIAEYNAAFDVTHDPVLFFKLGNAEEKAGQCDAAVGHWRRYLAEAQPPESFVTTTKDKIKACGADPDAPLPPPQAPPVAPPEPPTPTPAPAPSPEVAPVLGTTGVAETPAPPPTESPRPHGNDPAWLLVGGSLAFATAGAVLAYAASSSEQDISDLYIELNGRPPSYDAKVKARYEALVDEGNRYKHLSWAGFGIAAGCGLAATYLFLRARGDDDGGAVVTPVLTPAQAGVAAQLRF